MCRKNYVGCAVVSLFEFFAYAKYRFKTRRKRRFDFEIYGNVGFGKILSSFAVTDNNVFNAEVAKHCGAYFARVCSALFPVQVFRTDMNICALCGFNRVLQVYERNADNNFAFRIFYNGRKFFDKSRRFGRGLVHFPVARDYRFSFGFVHFMFLLIMRGDEPFHPL